METVENIGKLALTIVIAFLLIWTSDTNRNITTLADKINQLSVQVTSMPIVEYDARYGWALLSTNAVTAIEIKP